MTSGDVPPAGVLRRVAARVVLLDDAGRVLLFRGGDPARPQDGTWWFTPGGGLEDGESPPDAARRELREETGLDLAGDLGPVVHERTARFSFQGREYAQEEYYFRAVVPAFEVDRAGWTEIEVASMDEHRWWTAAELRATTDTFYPRELPDLL